MLMRKRLHDFISMWRNRWSVMGWRERSILSAKISGVVVVFLLALWLAAWYAFGPPSVRIGDVDVDLDRSLSLAGPDVNANGIRDDVDNYIKVLAEKKAYSKPQVKALEQDARAMQELVTVDLNDAKAIRAVADMIGRSSWCRFQRFEERDAYQLGQQLGAIAINTKRRVIADMEFSRAMDGTTSASPEGESCES